AARRRRPGAARTYRLRPDDALRGVRPHRAARRPAAVRGPGVWRGAPRRRWRVHGLGAVIVPGVEVPEQPVSAAVLAALRAAAARRARVASICSGAFVLAQAGLLDGLRVTTHWIAAGLLAELFPQVTVDANVLFVDHGRIL